MKMIATIVSAAAALSLATAAVAKPPFLPAPVSDSPYRFAGYSSQTTVGSDGYDDLYSACQGDFGNEARACLSEEFIRSPNIFSPSSSAWILPSINAGGIDFSGTQFNLGSVNCGAWTNASNAGLLVEPNGGFSTATCNVARPVTCCVPMGSPQAE